jgi:MoxR-like ATPase
VVAGNELLAAKPESSGAAESWRLRLESVAREIDAGFATDQLPPELKAVRTRLIAAINPSSLAAA